MGFFSSRKAEDNNNYQVAIGVGGSTDEKSVVQVIRSRFYGKKGKEREDQPISFRSGATPAQTLSNSHVPVASSPLASSKASNRGAVAGPSILRHNNDRPLPATPTSAKKRPTGEESHPPSPTTHRQGGSLHVKTNSTHSASSSSPRKNPDSVTVTLAQRLNELASANSEGLLNDDEYRLLRQNLFERFATNATIPTEIPVVPVSPARPRPPKGSATPDRPTSRPLSNFHVERPMSIASKSSATTGMSGLFRRATGRGSTSRDHSDTSSVWSAKSNTSFFRMPRILSKKSSDSSIHTTASRQPTDAMSISSRRVGSDREHDGSVLQPPAPRSAAGSIRRMQTPPSSFPSRVGNQETRNTASIYNVFEEDHLSTVQEIQQEILNVEAEAKRLMDAFNGLEVTTLAKSQRHRIRPLKSSDSAWGGDSDGRSQRRINLADDAISMRSGISVGTAPSMTASMARSTYSGKKSVRSKAALPSPMALNPNSRPSSLHRKNSSSSVTSERRERAVPPVPALPNSISHGHLKGASNSNISLVRSTGHLPMNTVPEDEQSVSRTVRLDSEDLEMELEGIRRRREEVSGRYDTRLEFLRAKLKGAQLHEKLMRK